MNVQWSDSRSSDVVISRKRADMMLKQHVSAGASTAAVRQEMSMAETSQFAVHSDGGVQGQE